MVAPSLLDVFFFFFASDWLWVQLVKSFSTNPLTFELDFL